MDRFQIVLGHYRFYMDNHTGQNSAFYKRLCRIRGYFKGSDNDLKLDREGNETALDVYNSLAQKHNCPEF
jgi:hypothetical protein